MAVAYNHPFLENNPTMPSEQAITHKKQRQKSKGSGSISSGSVPSDRASSSGSATALSKGRRTSNPDIVAKQEPPTPTPVPSLESLHQQVQAATSPFGGSNANKPSTDTHNSHENTLKYFLAVTTFFPAAVAILAPANMWNSSDGTDFANMFTNTVVVLLLAWAIKFSVEWPWKWLKKIKKVKATLIGYANSSLQNQEPSFASLVQLLHRTVYFENVALLACLVVPLLGSGLMWGGRNYITVDEYRKKLVFNNLNIVLFESWSVLRWALAITDSWHKSYDKSGDVLTEHNLSSLFQEEPSFLGSLSSKVHNSKTVSEPEPEPEPEQVEPVQDEFSEKLASLESKSEEQRKIMDTLLGFQEKEYSSIVSYLSKLEKTILELSQSSTKSSPKDSVFVKPFPLNLKLEHDLTDLPKLKIPASSTLRIQALDTISEVESLDETISPNNSPVQESFEDDVKLKSPFPRREYPTPVLEKQQKSTYSLHGIPATSTLKHIITDKSIYTDDIAEGDQTELQLPESSTSTELSSMVDQRGQPVLMKEFLHIAHYLKENVTIYKFVKNPWQVIRSVYAEFRSQLLRSQSQTLVGLQQSADLYKLVLINLMNHYVLNNTQSVVQYFEHVKELLIKPLVKLCKFVLLFSVRMPLNVLKLWINLQLFIPKMLFKVFVLYPVTVVTSKFSKEKKEKPEPERIFKSIPREIPPLDSPVSPNFPAQSPTSELPFGMKKFRLSPSLSPTSQFATDSFDNGNSSKSNGEAVRKLTNHFRVENDPVPVPVPVLRKPVTGRGASTYHRIATPVVLHSNQREVY